MRLNITLQIEMPDEFATADSMDDLTVPTLMEKVRKEVEDSVWLNSDADPHNVSVSLVINGQVESQVVQEAEPVRSGVLATGTRVSVTHQREMVPATVIGFDSKYRLHKVRTDCGKTLLRTIKQEAVAATN